MEELGLEGCLPPGLLEQMGLDGEGLDGAEEECGGEGGGGGELVGVFFYQAIESVPDLLRESCASLTICIYSSGGQFPSPRSGRAPWLQRARPAAVLHQ